jgi:hypothetical protein
MRTKSNNQTKHTNLKTFKLKPTFGIAPTFQTAETPIGQSPAKPMAAIAANRPATPETLTEIAARIDVGLGNTLFIRGQGDGLSWDKGAPLECQDGSTWVWSTRRANDRLIFKLLLNDLIWAQGDDLIVEPGKKIEVAPRF